MTLDDAKTRWQSEEAPDEPMSDEEILSLVREESHSLKKKIRRRDLREGIAAVFVFLLFGWMAVATPIWLVRVGAAIIMAGSVFIWWTLRRARPADDDAVSRSVAEELRHERAALDRQIALLENVLWWYIAPLTVGEVVVAVGLVGVRWAVVPYVAGFLAFAAFLYWLNQRAVRRDLHPKRERLTQLLAQVER